MRRLLVGLSKLKCLDILLRLLQLHLGVGTFGGNMKKK